MLTNAGFTAFAVCCFFTLASPARADDSHNDLPGPSGLTARIGSSVGFTNVEDQQLSGLGGQVAMGIELDFLAVEVEYESLSLLEYNGLSNDKRGELRRVGIVGRLFFATFQQSPTSRSRARLFADVGTGHQWGQRHGYKSFKRNDVSFGGGFLLDHTMKARRRGLPFTSIGWQLGWRITAVRRPDRGTALLIKCKGFECPTPELERGYDFGLVLGSSMRARW